MNMLYTLSGITKAFGGRTVLDIQSLEIEQGAVTALLGPNGAGKTTLLSILGFLSYPAQGAMSYQGREVRFAQACVLPLRKEVVLMAQHPIMFSGTVNKNMEYGLKIRGIPKQERRDMAARSLRMVGMEHFAGAKAHRLSGGETQRIAIARALALNPRVILCDEPLASVDSQNQAIIIDLLRRINKEMGISIVFTSHDALWAKNLADQVVYLDAGKTVDWTLENVFSAVVEAGPGGVPVCCFGDGMRLPIPGAPLGLRRISLDPSAISLCGPGEDGLKAARGTIVQLSREKNGVRVVVDAGAPFTVLLTEARYGELSPKIGDHVGLHIPPDGLTFLET